MLQEQLLAEIDSFLSKVKEIPTERNYWLIRTQSGEFYNSYRKYGFVAIEHDKVSLFEIDRIFKKNAGDKKAALKELKAVTEKKYPDDRYGLISWSNIQICH